MVTEALYERDSYLKEFTARVVRVEDNRVILNRSAFHPLTGGVAYDTGYLVFENRRYRVVEVLLERGSRDIVHVLQETPGFSEGDEVKGVIDWDRRYRLMRLHTAAHIISAIMYSDYGALITGGHVDVKYARDDFSTEIFDKRIFEEAIAKANDVVRRDLEVRIYFLRREEALKIPGIIKLAERAPPDVEILRIVEIPGVDIQADGGPHVRRTSEIGEIVMLKAENKGRTKRRVYYTVKP